MPPKSIRLSASALGMYIDCKRCFFLEYARGIHRPRGVFPSLPGGMDLVIKTYFDKYRKKGLPPELVGKVPGHLFRDQKLMDLWRNWRTSLRYEDKNLGAYLVGAFDDLLQDGEEFLPLDYKTRSGPPKEETSGYYQHQMDVYALLLEESGRPTRGEAYLVYFFPSKVRKGLVVDFDIEPKRVGADPKAARELFKSAVTLLRGIEPARHSSCKYCSWSARQAEAEGVGATL